MQRFMRWRVAGMLLALMLAGGVSGFAGAAPAEQEVLQGDRYIAQVVADREGNLVLVGFFQGALDLGAGPVQSNGRYDVLVAKLDRTGALLWSRSFGDSGEQFGSAVAVAPDGSIVIAGEFNGSVDFGGGPLVSAGAEDIFVAKLDRDGGYLWAQRFGDADSQTADAVALTSDGGVVLAGHFDGTLELTAEPLTSAGGQDILVLRLAADGAVVWARRFGDADTQLPAAVAVAADDSIALVGRFSGVLEIGGATLASAGGYDAFVAKLAGDGQPLWAKRFGDAETQFGNAVALLPDGSVAVGGQFSGTLDLGGSVLTSAGGYDAFVAVFDGAGGYRWSQRSGESGDQLVAALAVGSDGALYAVESVEQAGGAAASFGSALPAWTMVVSRYDAGGQRVWSQPFAEVSLSGVTLAATTDGVSAGGYLQTGIEQGDIVLKALDGTGSLLWERRLGG